MTADSEKISRPEANANRLTADTRANKGIAVGLNASGTEVHQVYWLRGRDELARRQRLLLVAEGAGKIVRTLVYDEGKAPAASYTTMQSVDSGRVNHHIVTSSNQTGALAKSYKLGRGGLGTMHDLLQPEEVEPYAPRLVGVVNVGLGMDGHGKPRKIIMGNMSAYTDPSDAKATDPNAAWPFVWSITDDEPGEARAVHSYARRGRPVPVTSPIPYRLPLGETAAETARIYRDIIGARELVALAVKSIVLEPGSSPEYVIINRPGAPGLE